MNYKYISKFLVVALTFSVAQSFARSAAGQRSNARVTDMSRNNSFIQERRAEQRKKMAENNDKSTKAANEKKLSPKNKPRNANKKKTGVDTEPRK